ncbi:GntR family transcriptional regulator [Acidithrix sp. C25]|uniref:GntR family transcriptional regulator n=1 Tax=Acidithrix sp. C25 TaxID=1671482 RepID=UPI00191B9F46|nr:GntR family transcriptional regulator [Acidithrix sp. C25]
MNDDARKSVISKTVSISEALTEELRSKVLDGDIPAGSLVTETEVASTYGVSRPTAKSAIQSLTHDGLLRRRPKQACLCSTFEQKRHRGSIFCSNSD